jgi:hypothetical protein
MRELPVELASPAIDRGRPQLRSSIRVIGATFPPSNTDVHSHAAWVRKPMIGALPSCESFSKKVVVCDYATSRVTKSSLVGVLPHYRGLYHHRCTEI